MLETENLVRKYTHICTCIKYTFWYQDPINVADGSILQKISISFAKNSTFTQSNSISVC